ncbi:MAG TPA: zinc-binding dehydrogenase, partial [bacterium]|nr:zinc-binding dehydrogenase [bacterium]
MRAAVYYKPYSKLQLEEWATPTPGPDEVLVQVAACGICHTDLQFIDHGVPPLKSPPLILGHEIAGTIAEAGEQVGNLSVGQRVLIAMIIPCNQCKYCKQGRTNLCRAKTIPGNKIHGGYAEYLVVPASGIVPLPDDIPVQEATAIGDVFGAPYHALIDIGKVRAGETVLIFGSGGLGAAAIQIAKSIGAYVIALDMNPLKLKWAEQMGADETINAYGIRDLGAHLRDRTDGGVDIALEAVGAPRTIYQAFTCLAPAGRLIILGYTRNEFKIPEPQLIIEERAILGVRGCPITTYQTIFDQVIAGIFRL